MCLRCRKANDAGIPVFTVDRGADGGVVISHIASDNVAGGAAAAEFLCDALDGSGKVVELEGIAGTSAARDRGQGFNDYMSQECSGVEIIARQTANFNRAEGLTVYENILQAQPEIDGTFAHNDEMILGAIELQKQLDEPMRSSSSVSMRWTMPSRPYGMANWPLRSHSSRLSSVSWVSISPFVSWAVNRLVIIYQ